jgi:hypothetical protein
MHEQDIAYRLDRLEDGTFVIHVNINHASLATSGGDFEIVLEIANTVCPMDNHGQSQDSRRLGLAVNWVEVEPA